MCSLSPFKCDILTYFPPFFNSLVALKAECSDWNDRFPTHSYICDFVSVNFVAFLWNVLWIHRCDESTEDEIDREEASLHSGKVLFDQE